MSEYTEQAESFLKRHGLKFTAKKTGRGPYFEDDKESRDIYRLTLRRVSYKKGEFAPTSGTQKTWFRFGASIADTERGEAPTVYDLLAGISKEDPGTFEDFCANFGYDTDSRKAFKTYGKVRGEWAKVQRFFTAEEIQELQEIQ